jgi:hypothetical protein
MAGAGISFASFGMNLARAMDNPNPDTVSDVIISGIGLFGTGGTIISVGLTLGKETVKGTIKAVGDAREFTENAYRSYKKEPFSFFMNIYSFGIRFR